MLLRQAQVEGVIGTDCAVQPQALCQRAPALVLGPRLLYQALGRLQPDQLRLQGIQRRVSFHGCR